ncbi:hypothetical protein DSL64_06350 [Dyadobacter luteus]|jgi:hypothetical protein|uniref:Uncharacterized protein n=1 Tax=Dyadobacter luteus TaxID=2259619 RepID=A0A3D8YF78_9BACT|nr:hypothetical protein [Dyadobacter luteus]REA63232.1 hypothetical protein DSL64_06350 [Dyadobacter luteus]
MKNLIHICTIFPLLFILLGSCKEKSATPVDTTVSIAEMVDYYIVAEVRNIDRKLYVLSFAKDGNIVKASAHVRGGLRIQEANLDNGTFKFDHNSDGALVFTFSLEKDANGKMRLKSYDLIKNGIGNNMSHALVVKKSEVTPILNKSFWVKTLGFKLVTEENRDVLQWIDGKRYAAYKLDNYGFKTNQDEFMGIMVPSWTSHTSPVMLIESGDQVTIGTTE